MCFVRADKAESQGEHLAQGIHGSERDSEGSLSLRTSPGSRLTTGEMRLGGELGSIMGVTELWRREPHLI